MTLDQLVIILASFARSLVPIESHAFTEQRDVTELRYEAYAREVAEVELDEDPLPGLDIVRSALVIVNVTARESYFRADVMNCGVRGLGGAWGPMQFQGPRVLACSSWRSAIRLGHRMAAESFARCAGLPIGDRLSIFTDGVCRRRWQRSRVRIGPALRWPIDQGDGEAPDA